MAGAHVPSLVGIGSAEGGCEEGLLMGALAGHVGLGKKMPDALIRQHLVVENIYSGINGRGTTQLSIKGTHGFFSNEEAGERIAPPHYLTAKLTSDC